LVLSPTFEFFLLGFQLFLGQLPGRPVGQSPLIICLHRPHSGADFQVKLLFLVLYSQPGLFQVQAGLGKVGPGKKVGSRQVQGQTN